MSPNPKRQPKQIPLFDRLMREFKLHSDSAVGRFTGTQCATMTRIRYGDFNIGDAMVCRISRATGWSVAEIDELAALSNK